MVPARGTDQKTAVTDATAENHDRALAVVQKLLKAKGVHSYAVHTIGLKLSEGGKPWPLGQRTRYAPELVACDEGGRAVASVTIGPRPGGYLVSLPNVPGLRNIRRERPEKVAQLILSAHPEGRP